MNKIALLLIVLILFGCGPSKEEQAKTQRLREDSIRNAVAERFAKIQSIKDSIVSAEAVLRKTSNLLIVRRANLEAARDKLNQIRGFQFLRTESEREQQIRDQTIVIENLEIEVRRLATRVDNRELAVRNFKATLLNLQ